MKIPYFIFLFLPLLLPAQVRDSLLVETYHRKAQGLINQMEFDSAIYYYQQSESVSLELQLYPKYIKAMQIRAILLEKMGNFALVDSLINKIEMEGRKYLPDESPLFLAIYNDLVVNAAFRKNREKREVNFRKAQRWMEAYGQSEQSKGQYSQLLINMGAMIMEEGDAQRSIQYLGQGIRQLEEFSFERPEIIDLVITACQHLAYAYRGLEEYDSSLVYAERSLSLYKSSPLTNPFLFSRAYMVLGTSLQETGNLDQSIQVAQELLAMLPSIPSEAKRMQRESEAKQILGISYKEKGELSLALQTIKESLALQKQFFSQYARLPRHQSIGVSTFEIGDMHRLQGEYELALTHFQEALSYSCFRFNETDPNLNPSLEDIKIDASYHFKILRGKAEVLSILAKQNNSHSYYKASFESYQLLIDLIARERHRYQGEQSKLSMMAETYPAFEGAIEAAWQLYTMTDSASYAHAAFHIMEKSKAALLTDELLRADAQIISVIPDSIIHLENLLQKESQDYHEKVLQISQEEPINDSILKVYQTKEWACNQKREEVDKSLEKQYPLYHELKSTSAMIDLAQTQDQLRSLKAGLLEYFWGEHHVYVFGLSSSEKVFLRLDTAISHRKNLNQILEHLHTGKSPSDDWFFKEARSDLSQWLCTPITGSLSEVKRLIIIPDGPLGYLPFELLTPPSQPDQTTYLLEQYPISYANSASLLFREGAHPQASIPFAAYGPSYQGELQLPYTESEVQSLQVIMGGQAYIGQQATEKRFRESGVSAKILHFAMHGFPNAENPSQSSLVFQTDPDIEDDGHLYAYELYNLNLSAELAVLSACHTGYGPIAKGEGIRSLARAFQYAGCPSVVMSLWEANGVVAKDLMPLFYGYLKEGLAKDVALQQAKLNFLATSPVHLHDPRFWGNFVLIGNSSTLKENETGKKWWLICSFLAILGLGFWGIRSIKRSRLS